MIEHPAFTVKVQPFDGITLLHIEVKKWSAGTYKDMLVMLPLLQELYGELYCQRMSDKQQKFIEMLGFQRTDLKVLCVDDQHREVWKWVSSQ